MRANPSITPLNVSMGEGTFFEIVCQTLYSWPSSKVTWLADSVPLSNSTQFTIRTQVNQSASGLYQVTSRLRFRSSIPSQSGIYLCRTDQSLPSPFRPISSFSPPATVLITGELKIKFKLFVVFNRTLYHSIKLNFCIYIFKVAIILLYSV